MIRITQVRDGSWQHLLVEGTLSDGWVEALKTSWSEAQSHSNGEPLRVDLSGVTYVDDRGRELLARMIRSGAELRARGIMTRAVVEEITEMIAHDRVIQAEATEFSPGQATGSGDKTTSENFELTAKQKGVTTMSNFPLLDACAKNWWVWLVRGLFAVLFGVMAFARPGTTLVALVFLYGAYALVDGVTALWAGVSTRAWWLVLSGLLGIAVGVGTFFYPGITAVALFYLIAAWAVIRGVFEIVAALEFRKEIRGEWALILGGIFSIIFGVVLVAYPVPGVLALVWLIGSYALVFGVTMIVLAFQLRSLPQKLEMHPGVA